MENKLIEEMENEFFSEICDKQIEISDLEFIGVPELALQEESFLRNIYGDGFVLNDNDQNSNIDASKRSITKVNLNEIEKMSEVTYLIDELKNSKFNSNLDIVMSKIKEEETE